MRRLVGQAVRLLEQSQRAGGSGGVTGDPVRDSVPERESEELRVMTFNVRGSGHQDGNNVWSRRSALNVEVIKRWQPDLIGFQEFQRGNQETYERELPGYEKHPGPRYENRKPHSFNAVFWNPERLELVDSEGFWLSETPEEFSGAWGTKQIRSANLNRFRLIPEGSEFFHLNTHLDHRSIPSRQNGTKLIVDRLEASRETPTIITGDFNAQPGKQVYRTLEEAGFEDSHLLSGSSPEKTFHHFEGEKLNAKRDLRMDWIMVRGGSGGSWSVASCEVVHDCDPPIFPSDHYPVNTRLFLG